MRQSGPVRWRMWLVAAVLVAALAGVWSGLWFYAASKADEAVAGWRAREARIGRIYTCERQTISGFPFRIDVDCADPGIELRRDDPPVALKANNLRVTASVFQPTVLTSEFHGPMTIAEPGRTPGYTATWTHAQSRVRGTPAAPEQVEIVVDHPAVERSGETPATVMKADRVGVQGRLAEGSAPGNPLIEIVLSLAAAVAPELHPFTKEPLDADVSATLYGLTDVSPKPWPVRFKEMQARGGKIEITRARIQQGDAIAVSAGTLGLTARGGLDGQIKVTIVGLDKIVKSLDIDRMANQDGAVKSAIGALDRFIPGLGQLARQNAGPSIVTALRAMGQATTLEGKPAVTLPLRFADGQVLLGPFQVARMPMMF